MAIRRSARLRLTLWYGALALVVGATVLLLGHVLVRRSLTADPKAVREAIERRLDTPLREVAARPNVVPLGEQWPDGLNPRFYLPASGTLPEAVGAVLVFPDVQQSAIEEALDRMLRQSGLLLLALAFGSLGLGWVMAGRVLRPIHQITSAARRLSEETLHERIDLQGPRDELRELADTFDAMSERLDAAFAAQREFVANASHELRTPLTIIRTELDVTTTDPAAGIDDYRAMTTIIHEAVERCELLIDSLLTLARSEGRLRHDDLDLATMAGSVVENVLAVRPAGNVRVETALGPAPVAGDPSLLERLVGNLVENGVRHNRDGGWLWVETNADRSWSRVVVANSGSTMAEAEVPLLFQRFYRPDRSRSRSTGGAGLGLSIVRAVAEAHGGRATARALPEGGLEVTVELPVAEVPVLR